MIWVGGNGLASVFAPFVWQRVRYGSAFGVGILYRSIICYHINNTVADPQPSVAPQDNPISVFLGVRHWCWIFATGFSLRLSYRFPGFLKNMVLDFCNCSPSVSLWSMTPVKVTRSSDPGCFYNFGYFKIHRFPLVRLRERFYFCTALVLLELQLLALAWYSSFWKSACFGT